MTAEPYARLSLWPNRRWWLVLAVILLAGAAFRTTGYNFSLPYVDHPDEPNYAIAGRMLIDVGSAKPLGMHGYPPGIIHVFYVLQRLFHDPATPPTTVVGTARLIAITANLGALALVGLLGYRLGFPLGGLFGAALWAVNPVVVQFSRYATADSFVTFFSLLALFLALTAALYDRDRWATWAVVALMLAIVFKYQAVFLAPVVLLTPLWRLWRGADRRRVLRNLATNVGWLAVFAFWLVVLFPALEVDQAPHFSGRSSRLGSLTLETLAYNVRAAFEPLAAGVLWLPALLGLAVLCLRPPERAARFSAAVLLAAAVVAFAGVTVFGRQDFRQFVTVAALACVLVGVGLAALVPLLHRALTALLGTRRRLKPALVAALSALVLLALLPDIRASIADAREHTLPDRRNELARWMDASLPAGDYIAELDNHKTLNGAWGGYAGTTIFHYVETAHVRDRSLADWRARGVTYAIESYGEYAVWDATPEGRALLDQTLLLRAFPPQPDVRGPSMAVLRLYPPQHEADGQLGPVHLVGYDLDRVVVSPGGSVTFTLYWRADAPLEAEYAVYNHLLAEVGTLVAQADGAPLLKETRGTTAWTDPGETLISRPFTLTVPEDAPPGEYRLMTGFYRRDTGERLAAPDGGDGLLLAAIRIAEE